MNPARTTTRLLRLYPRSWRLRYGDELEALILDMSGPQRVPWRIRADVAVSGGRERLRAAGLGGDSADARVRGGASLVLWAWALFVVAGTIVQKTSEHWRHALPSGSHTAATVAFGSLIGVAIAAAVIVVAGIALTLPALGRFLRRRRLDTARPARDAGSSDHRGVRRRDRRPRRLGTWPEHA